MNLRAKMELVRRAATVARPVDSIASARAELAALLEAPPLTPAELAALPPPGPAQLALAAALRKQGAAS